MIKYNSIVEQFHPKNGRSGCSIVLDMDSILAAFVLVGVYFLMMIVFSLLDVGSFLFQFRQLKKSNIAIFNSCTQF